MPSTNKTPLGFNQWIPTDLPDMDDFNADNLVTEQELQKRAVLSGANFTGRVNVPSIAIKSDDTNLYQYFQRSNGDALAYVIYSPDLMRFRLASSGYTHDLILSPTDIRPGSNGGLSIGTSSLRWDNAYLNTAPIIGSDQRIKGDISSLEISLVTKLLMSIPAVRYRLIDGESGRFHYGFIAQDVENALTESELTGMDFAGFIKSPAIDDYGNETGDYIYALRLEEFIPILWSKCQDFETRLRKLENK